MIGKIIGAFIGGKAAQHTRGIGGPTGAALGVLAPVILRRISWPAMIALGAGGYLASRLAKKKSEPDAASKGERPTLSAKTSGGRGKD